ncbi:hypothetical protein ACGE0T_00520 [Parabacteroides sp. APC149_11_2_Y6]
MMDTSHPDKNTGRILYEQGLAIIIFDKRNIVVAPFVPRERTFLQCGKEIGFCFYVQCLFTLKLRFRLLDEVDVRFLIIWVTQERY